MKRETEESTERIKYSVALARLNEIVELVENQEIDVDDLEALVKEAVDLITLCRGRLAGTQAAVEQALGALKTGPEAS